MQHSKNGSLKRYPLDSRSLLLRECDILCSHVSLVAMDLPCKMAWILMKVMTDEDLDEPG